MLLIHKRHSAGVSNFLYMCGSHTTFLVYIKETYVSGKKGSCLGNMQQAQKLCRTRLRLVSIIPFPDPCVRGTYALNRGLLGNLWSTYICFYQCIYLHFDRVVGICLKQRRMQVSKELRVSFRGNYIFQRNCQALGG